MTAQKVPQQPLRKIGLSLSGGGYRAASFHLGAMSYLQHLSFEEKPLLENVKIISTVSGGTISGVIYALGKQHGASFKEIYAFILRKLESIDLLKEGIEKLNPKASWQNPSKTKNLINAFSELYDREFTQGKTFAEFDEMKSHLEAVIFNSTEFENGINFRFRNKDENIFGNFKIPIKDKVAGEVKLSDVLAASSCFTGGFEPLIWPHDFVYEGAVHLMEEKKTRPPLGLMDGGIYDNQGVESLLNYKKSNGAPYLDLVIVSDVTSPYMEAYRPAGDPPKTGFRKLTLQEVKKKVKRINTGINLGMVVLILLLLAAPLLSSGGYGQNLITGIGVGAAAAFLVVLIAKGVAVYTLKKEFAKVFTPLLHRIPAFYREKFTKLKIDRLSVRRLEPLIVDRLFSLYILLMNVFLKIVRRLNYYKLYENKAYCYRRVSNLIRELTEEDFNARQKRNDEDDPVSENYNKHTILKGAYAAVIGTPIKEIAEEVVTFGTTLWFTKEDKLANMLYKLIVAGQFTMCYNLLEYLEILIYEEGNGYDQLPAETKTKLEDTYKNCKSHWLQFKTNPYFLFNDTLPPGHSKITSVKAGNR